MSEIISSGYLTPPAAEKPSESASASSIGGLRIAYKLLFFKTAETKTYAGKTYNCSANSFMLYYCLYGWFGVNNSGSTYISSTSDSASGYVRLRDENRSSGKNIWSMTGQSVSYRSARAPRFSNHSQYVWTKVTDPSDSNYKVYPEGLIEVEAGKNLSLKLTYNNIRIAAGQYVYTISDVVDMTAKTIEVPKSKLATIQVMRNGIWVPHEIDRRESGEWHPYSANIRKGSEWVPYS